MIDLPPTPPEPMTLAASVQVRIPSNLPVECIMRSASDYVVPPLVMVAIIKTESNGRSVVGKNKGGSYDVGVAQHNSQSWVPFFAKHYGITEQELLNNPCQSIRAQAYSLRYEMNHAQCRSLGWAQSVWCAVKRYHAPNNERAANEYLNKVLSAYSKMIQLGQF